MHYNWERVDVSLGECGSLDKASKMQMFEYQNLDWDTATDVPIDPIVINDWYVALEPTRNVKVWYLIIEQTNNGATNEDLEIELTINGVVFIANGAAIVSGDPRYIVAGSTGVFDDVGGVRQVLSLDGDQSAPLETRSLGIRVRQTTAVDLVSAIIEVNMVYATLEQTS